LALPLVSIVIPCYNAAFAIGAAIESALGQTYANTETIVIDDGSHDDSAEIIRRYGTRIRRAHRPHRGGSAARNHGLELARGAFVQFLDADDVLLPDCVEAKVQARLKAPDLCPCSDWRRVDEDGTASIQRPSVTTADPVVAMLAGQTQTSSPLHVKQDLERVNGFDEGLVCSQDRDLHLRLACHGVRFSHLKKVLFEVRRRAGSVSGDINRVLVQRGFVFERAAHVLAASGCLTRERRFALAFALSSDGRRLFHRGLVPQAKEHWRLAAKLDPAGFRAAYGRTATRGLLSLMGPVLTEHIVAGLRTGRWGFTETNVAHARLSG
jgi:glycosyltransferase involved in cell wall biosynthesis